MQNDKIAWQQKCAIVDERSVKLSSEYWLVCPLLLIDGLRVTGGVGRGNRYKKPFVKRLLNNLLDSFVCTVVLTKKILRKCELMIMTVPILYTSTNEHNVVNKLQPNIL